MKKIRRDGHEALKRVTVRAMQDVPHIDDDAGKWESSRAEAYATSVVRRGLVKGVRERGNGAAARRNLIPRFRARLEHLRDMTAQLGDIRGDAAPSVEFLDQTRDWADGIDEAAFWSLSGGLTVAASDDDLFAMVSVQGVSPEQGETERTVVVETWTDGEEVHAIVHAMANAIYGVQGLVMDRYGEITSHPVNDLIRSRDEGREIARRIFAMIADGALQNMRYSVRKVREQAPVAAPEDLQIELHDRADVDTSSWEAVSSPIARVPLAAGEELALAKRAEGNAVLRALVSAISPVLVDGAEATPDQAYLPLSGGVSPYHALAIAKAAEQGLVEQTLKDLKANAKTIIAAAREQGEDRAQIAKMEAAAEILEQPETLRDIASETVAEHYAAMEPVYSAAARFLARIARAQNDGMSVDVSAHGEIHGDDDPVVSPTAPHHGIVVIRDSALAEAATDSQIIGTTRRTDHPLVVMFSADQTGADAVVLQVTTGAPTLCGWRRIEANPHREDDLTWYLRKAVGASIARRDGAATAVKVEEAAPAPTAPVVRQAVMEVDGLKLAAHPHPDRLIREDADRTGLRAICQVQLGLEDPELAVRVLDAWFSQHSIELGRRVVLDQRDAQRGWRIEHRDDTGRYLWAVSARMNREERTTVGIVVETNRTGNVGARLPRVVRVLAAAMRVDGLDGPVSPTAVRINGNAQMLEFRRLATDPGRDLPILLISDDAGRTIVDPDTFAGQAAGVMHVFLIGKTRSFDLSDTWGRDLSAYQGAARLYRPGFNPASDTSQQHPLYFPGADADQRIGAVLSRETSETLHRYQVDTSKALTDDIEDAIRGVTGAVADRTEERAAETPVDPTPEEAAAVTPASTDEPVAVAPVAEPPTASPVPPSFLGPMPTPTVHEADADDDDMPAGGSSIAAVDEETASELSDDDGDEEAGEGGEAFDGGFDFGSVPFEGSAPARRRASRAGRAPASAVVVPPRDETATSPDLEEAVRRALGPVMDRLGAFEARFDGLERDLELSGRRAEAIQAVASEREAESQEQLNLERRENNELITIVETERDEAYAEVERLRRTIATLEAELSTYRAGRTPVQAWRPEKLDAIPDWVDERFGGRVTIMPRCQHALRKADHSDIPRLLDAIELLAGPYVDMKRGDGAARELWLKGLEALRLEDTPHQVWGGPSASEYQITYRNKTLQLDKHIKGRESTKRDDHMIRIYYTWNEEAGEVLIGHMPGHLTMRGR